MFARKESFSVFISLYPATTAIVFIQALFFIAIQFPGIGESLLNMLIGANLSISEGEYWRLASPIFLHASFPHFMFNTLSTLILAPALELMLKQFRFIMLYMACGIGANVFTFLLLPAQYIHLGASGAIYGLIGFYVSISFLQSSLISKQDNKLIKALALIGFIVTFIQPNVNAVAHISGFLIGFAVSLPFIKTSTRDYPYHL
ncbi:rhomboid family intramembrane serine protease [Bacillus sp. 1P06AnD]|uniref:rhomboid family intramembrane serine protease n=1 Tax=Bacillus sp. 1P06AnD TaxID=3132208 RepID=UPI00399F7377